jgi:hypothetical protein
MTSGSWPSAPEADTRKRLPILDLPLPDPAPGGAEWIEAYRAWFTGAWS